MSNNQPKLLVTGASGNLGSLVVKHLVQTLNVPASQIVAASRNPEKLSNWAALGVETRSLDFADPSSLAAALEGIDRVLLISTDSADSSVRLAQHTAAIEAIQASSVVRIVYTSMPEPETSPVSFSHVHLTTENAVKASGKHWTILRNAWYFENLTFTLPSAIASGTLYSAAGDGRISYISRSDLALAAAKALIADSEFEDTTVTLTGLEALTVHEVVERVGAAIGKTITVVPVPDEAIVQGAMAHGLPQIVAEMFASFDVATHSGHLGQVTHDFERLTGQTPQSFADWLAENLTRFQP